MLHGVLRECTCAVLSEAFTSGTVGKIARGGCDGNEAGVFAFVGCHEDVVVGLEPTQIEGHGLNAAENRQNLQLSDARKRARKSMVPEPERELTRGRHWLMRRGVRGGCEPA